MTTILDTDAPAGPAMPNAPTRSTEYFMSGMDALLEGIFLQRRADGKAHVAAFISGYRGSPLGAFDSLLWKHRKRLDDADITFKPGLNEDLAATACWGTQQLALVGTQKYDGVTAFWYGKGPGVDRAGDVLKHANMAGTMPRGGVVMLVGDDHGSKSSTVAHQSDQALIAAGIPILYPANVQEYIDYMPAAVSLSRFASVWVAFKCVTEAVEASMLVDVPQSADWQTPRTGRPAPVAPGFQPAMVEKSLFEERLPAAQAFARLNALDRTTHDAPTRSIGIIASGKAYVDLMEALRLIGLTAKQAEAAGVRVFKPMMIWPLTPEPAVDFCRGHTEVLVIEEKRSLVEEQLAAMLLTLQDAERPLLIGKRDPVGKPMLPAYGELDSALLANVLRARLSANGIALAPPSVSALPPFAKPAGKALSPRMPAFCSGCPHNRSTRIPDGSSALGGIGCHGMALMVPELRTPAATHMGGEGANWIGMADYVDTDHIFQNMGEGTYAHSGALAIRAAVAAKVNITYKILFNSATAMTGGQPVEGEFTADDIIWQLHAEKVGQIVLLTEYPQRARSLPKGVAIYPRTELEAVQQRLREIPGVTALVYEQGCAAERRRLRKQKAFPDPAIRTYINPAVCEGCGDCGKKSACVSLVPLPTELGVKRAVDQESCNKDYSCVEGFCPSFVTVKGGAPRVSQIDMAMAQAAGAALAAQDEPMPVATGNLLIAGIGGTGTITLGATLAQAALLDGKRVTTFDVTGLAQKNGPVYSHIRVLAGEDDGQYQPRIPAGQLDILIGCDIASAAAPSVAPLLSGDRSRAFINHHLVPVAAFQRNPDLRMDAGDYADVLASVLPPSRLALFDPGDRLSRILGQGPLMNIALLGFALQTGNVPIRAASIEAALTRGGKPDFPSLFALRIGRLLAIDPARAEALAGGEDTAAWVPLAERTLEQIIVRSREILTAYQNPTYAERYERKVRAIALRDPNGEVARIFAANLFKLMRYKDEYEVARLYTDPAFMEGLRRDFTGAVQISFNLAPPLLAHRKTVDGEPRKMQFGPWMRGMFRLLAPLKILRGTPFDPFAWSADRKLERALIAEYEAWVDQAIAGVNDRNYAVVADIAAIPEAIRGYGPVKERSVEAARLRYADLVGKS